MESVLNVEVSCFANYDTPGNPVNVNLLSWLSSSKYRQEVEQIRTADEETRKRLKSRLPAITPSGTFTYRKTDCLIQHSGFIQIDIDYKDNQHLGNFDQLKEFFCNIPNVAYCGLSVGGMGFWGLIPIAYPEKHRQHFDALEIIFKQWGIVIDEKPKNVASLRGYSFDSAPYFNHNAIVFENFVKPPVPRKLAYSANPTGDQRKTEACLEEIHRHKIDLTGNYKAWFDIGCSLAAAFGEAGRDYFHQVSQYYPDYTAHKTDWQFTECLKGGYSFTIATFLEYCDQAGIRYKGTTSSDTVRYNKTAIPTRPSAPPVDQETRAKVENMELPDTVLPVQFEDIDSISGAWTEEIKALQEYFSSDQLQPGPVKLDNGSTVTDPVLFAQSHLSILKENNGKRAFLPYLSRLQELRNKTL